MKNDDIMKKALEIGDQLVTVINERISEKDGVYCSLIALMAAMRMIMSRARSYEGNRSKEEAEFIQNSMDRLQDLFRSVVGCDDTMSNVSARKDEILREMNNATKRRS